MKTLAILLSAFLAFPLVAAEEPRPDLDKIEAALKSTPDDPILHYRKCQALFANGKEQEAVNHASIALGKFKAAKNDLAWMKLGSIKAGKLRIDVHYNMGPSERAEKKDGIVRPYGFRVWTTDAEPKLVRTLDFELGYIDGELLTAAIGESRGRRHANLGILDPKSDFATVKKKILEVVAK
jgi:hypothetical protein